MRPIRALFTIASVFAGCVLVSGVPLQSRAVGHDSVRVGSIFRAHPVNFQPHHPGNGATTGATKHPVVAVGHPDHTGHVPVVAVSHNHPAHMQHNLQPAQHHDVHTHAATGKGFQHGSMIAVGSPVHVHVDDLHRIGPDSHLPTHLHPTDAHNLAHEVYKHHFHANVAPAAAAAAHHFGHAH